MTDLLAPSVVLPVVLLAFGYRVSWVARVRNAIRQADRAALRRLPAPDKMVLRFWIWDAARFLGPTLDGRSAQIVADEKAAAKGREIIRRAAGRRGQ